VDVKHLDINNRTWPFHYLFILWKAYIKDQEDLVLQKTFVKSWGAWLALVTCAVCVR
jgi:hypothetical protein